MSPDDPDFLGRLAAIEKEPIWLDADGVLELARAARALHIERKALRQALAKALADLEVQGLR